jgi:hypothetical protein
MHEASANIAGVSHVQLYFHEYRHTPNNNQLHPLLPSQFVLEISARGIKTASLKKGKVAMPIPRLKREALLHEQLVRDGNE